MHEKSYGTPTVGLFFQDEKIQGASITLRLGKPLLLSLFEIPLDESSSFPDNVKPLYMNGEELAFHQLIDDSLLVTGLDAKNVLVRPLDIKLVDRRKIDAVIQFQAEPLLPYPAEKAIIDWLRISSTLEGSKLTIIAAHEEEVLTALKPWHSLRMEPEILACVPSALAAFSREFSPDQNRHFVLHLENEQATCVLVEEGKLLASYAIASGTNHPEKFKKEAEKALLSLGKGKQLPILLAGEGTLALKEYQQLHPMIPDGFDANLNQLKKFAVSIGYALSALPGYPDQVNFRQKEQAYPYPWKRVKTGLISYLMISIILSFVLWTFGNTYLSDRLDGLKQEYSSLLQVLHKPYTEFEKSYLNKVERQKPGEEVVADPIHYSKEDLTKRLQYLEKEVSSIPDTFALVPNIPKVSDVLAWLSAHPHVKGEEGKPGLSLQSFSYKMLKRPDQNKRREKYQVRVDLEFQAPNPTYAREFHDYLLAPNEFIDPNQEIKWSTSRGKYSASFYLKDKTVYP